MTCLPQGQVEVEKGVECHRGIALSSYSLFNDLFLGDSFLLLMLTWSGGKLLILICYDFLATVDNRVFWQLVSPLLPNNWGGLYNCYYYLEVCIVSLEVTVPVAVVYVVAPWVMAFGDTHVVR